MLQAVRSRIQITISSLDFSIDLILRTAIFALVSTQPIAELSAKHLPGVKGRPTSKADNLTSIDEPIFQELREHLSLTIQ
jgi:hypothetical protein